MSRDRIETFMTRHPHSVRSGENLFTAQGIMKKANCHHLPVLDGGELKGIISDRDIRMAPASEHKTRTVESMCIEEVVSVDIDTSVAVAAAIMAEKHISSIIVTEQGKMSGIFTTTDACRALATLLGPTA